ncbi:hypothetical protein BKI52_19395 [marine bacterium AO1-C]|nr:hypothetical protein BKI52_19395 [marine bacterium AO1-C]
MSNQNTNNNDTHIISLSNSSHTQATKLSEKFTAAYPIALLPLRTETRFMKVEQRTSNVMTGVNVSVTDAANALTAFGKSDVENVPLKKRFDAFNNHYQSFQTQLSEVAPEDYEALTVWKLGMIDEVFQAYNGTLRQQVQQEREDLQEVTQQLANALGVSLTRKKAETVPLGKNSLGAIENIKKAIVKHIEIVTGQPDLSPKSFTQELQKACKMLNDFSAAIATIDTFNQEEVAMLEQWQGEISRIYQPFNQLLEQQHREAQNQQNSLNQSLDKIGSELVEYQAQAQAKTPWSKEATNWKALVGIKIGIQQGRKALQKSAYEQALEKLAALDKSLSVLPEGLTRVEFLDPYTHIETLLIPEFLEEIKSEATNHLQGWLNELEDYRFKIQLLMQNTDDALAKSAKVPVLAPQLRTAILDNFQKVHELALVPVTEQNLHETQGALLTATQQLLQKLSAMRQINVEDRVVLLEAIGSLKDTTRTWQAHTRALIETNEEQQSRFRNQVDALLQRFKSVEEVGLNKGVNAALATTWSQLKENERLVIDRQNNIEEESLLDYPAFLQTLQSKVERLDELIKQNPELQENQRFALAKNLGEFVALSNTSQEVYQTATTLFRKQYLQFSQAINTLNEIAQNIQVSEKQPQVLDDYEPLLSYYTNLTKHTTKRYKEVTQLADIQQAMDALLPLVLDWYNVYNQFSVLHPEDHRLMLEMLNQNLDLLRECANNYKITLADLEKQQESVLANKKTLDTLITQLEETQVRSIKASSRFVAWQRKHQLDTQARFLESFTNKGWVLSEMFVTTQQALIEFTEEMIPALPNEIPLSLKGDLNNTLRALPKVFQQSLEVQQSQQKHEQSTQRALNESQRQLEAQRQTWYAADDTPRLEETLQSTQQNLVSSILNDFSKNNLLENGALRLESEAQLAQSLELFAQLLRNQVAYHPEDFELLQNDLEHIQGGLANWNKTAGLNAQNRQNEIAQMEAYLTNVKTGGANGGSAIHQRSSGIGSGHTTTVSTGGIIICTWGVPGSPGGGTTGGDPGDPPDPWEESEYELWIRVYPDAIAIDNHDPALTAKEIEAGQIYWTEVWNALNNRNLELGAWRAIVAAFGPQRAAWIVKQMTPTNLSSKPAPIAVEDDIVVFLQKELNDDLIGQGTQYWQGVLNNAQNPKQQAILAEEFKQRFSKRGSAEALTTVSRPEKFSQYVAKANQPDTDKGTPVPKLKPNPAFVQNQINQVIMLGTISSIGTLPVFPTPTQRASTWSKAPVTEVLPDQLVFLLYDEDGNVRYEEQGNLIPESLQTGLDPNDLQQLDPTKPNLDVNDNIKWMTDFAEAEKVGMARRIRILPEEGNEAEEGAGFAKLLVLGVKHFDRDGSTYIGNIEGEAKSLLEKLFEAHHYTDEGLSILTPGTPTNNTTEHAAGFTLYEADETTFETEILGHLPHNPPAGALADGFVLAKALGLNSQVFDHIRNSGQKSSANAEAMAGALWMNTWGFYLEEMYNLAERYSSANTQDFYFDLPGDVDFIKEFYVQFVKARGSLPTLRVGRQPYGILPVSALNYKGAAGWRWDDIDANAYLKHDLFSRFLLTALWGHPDPYSGGTPTPGDWATLANEKVFTVDDPVTQNQGYTGTLTGLQQQFMQILRLHPRSVSFYQRFALGNNDPAYGENFIDYIGQGTTTSFVNWLKFGTSFNSKFQYFLNSNNLISTGNTQIAKLRLLQPKDNQNNYEPLAPLTGPVVDDQVKSSSERTLSNIPGQNKNYIQWLLDTPPLTVYNASRTQTEPSKSLLYLSLRNAWFNQWWDAAVRILERENYQDHSYRHLTSLINNWDYMTEEYFVNQFPQTPLKNLIAQLLDWDLSNPSNVNLVKKRLRTSYVVHNASSMPVPPAPARPSTVGNGITIERVFNRIRYREFVVNVSGSIKPNPSGWLQGTKPEFADEVVAAEGRWPILTLNIPPEEITGIDQPTPLINFIASLLDNTAPANILTYYQQEMQGLRAMQDVLNELVTINTAELEKLFAEQMDLASHRLDAWILGMVNKRLDTMRSQQNEGVYLGAYGWLLDLKPGGKRTIAGGSNASYNVDKNLQVPEMDDADNQGYIMAPSLDHAMTAALLRSGYNAHMGTSDSGALEINLSSDRVRKSMFYLEGIRNGQPMGALLGYQLERKLYDNNLGAHVLDLRQHFPLEQFPESSSIGTTELLEANNVIDAKAFIEYERAYEQSGNTQDPKGLMQTLPNGVLEQLDLVKGELDAIGDLATAEGVYQVVKGNYARSSALLKTISEGGYVHEPEVIQTPRGGRNLTHKVGVLMNPVTNTQPIWATQLTPRAKAAPSLNQWIGEQLPPASQIKCIVTYRGTPTTQTISAQMQASMSLNMLDLNIEPIDLLYILPENLMDQNSELAKRCVKKVLMEANTTDATKTYDQFQVYFSRYDLNWSPDDVNVGEIANLVYNLKEVITNGRHMSALELMHSSTDREGLTDPYAYNVAEYNNRVATLYNDLLNAKTNLNAQDSESIWNLAAFGIDAAALKPKDVDVNGPLPNFQVSKNLVEQLVDDKINLYQQAMSKLSAGQSTEEQISIYLEAAQALVNKAFRMYPLFMAHNAAELQSCYQDRNAILPQNKPLVKEEWLVGLSRVRPQINRLENVGLLQEMAKGVADEGLELNVLQLPYRPNDAWVGVELPANYYKNHENDTVQVSRDKLSLVLQLPASFQPAQAMVGFVVDDWNEVIPNTDEIAGLTFHYDNPNAVAPQSILLAIHPKNSNTSTAWQWRELVEVLNSTLALAKLRAIEPDHLRTTQSNGTDFNAYSHILPATFARLNNSNLNVSPDWSTDYGLNNNNPVFPPASNNPGGGSIDDQIGLEPDKDLTPVSNG